MSFPKGFLWGGSISAAQIEGGKTNTTGGNVLGSVKNSYLIDNEWGRLRLEVKIC